MPTLLDLKTAAAGILGVSLSEFIVDGQDLWLLAANQVIKTAELDHDFEFNRKTVSVSVNGSTGGDLGSALDLNSNPVDVKTVIEVGVLDNQGNLLPVIWTTTAESIERQRQDNRGNVPLYRTDYEQCNPFGQSRFTFSGDQIYRWPKTENSEPLDFFLQMEVYGFTLPFTSSNLGNSDAVITGTLTPNLVGTFTYLGLDTNNFPTYANSKGVLFYDFINLQWILSTISGLGSVDFWIFPTANLIPDGTYSIFGGVIGTPVVTTTSSFSNIWTTVGQQFLLWATIVHLNKKFRIFVPRQEGNLPPPTDLMQEGLQTIIDWDTNKFELFRRHNR